MAAVYLLVFLCCVKQWVAARAWLTKARQGGSGGGVPGWGMDALSIMAALAARLRSRHVVVRERWSVRSQQSLTPPDPSSRQQQHWIFLCVDSQQNGFLHQGKCAMCWPGQTDVRGMVGIYTIGGFWESSLSLCSSGFEPWVAEEWKPAHVLEKKLMF